LPTDVPSHRVHSSPASGRSILGPVSHSKYMYEIPMQSICGSRPARLSCIQLISDRAYLRVLIRRCERRLMMTRTTRRTLRPMASWVIASVIRRLIIANQVFWNTFSGSTEVLWPDLRVAFPRSKPNRDVWRRAQTGNSSMQSEDLARLPADCVIFAHGAQGLCRSLALLSTAREIGRTNCLISPPLGGE
jgi:hypothetical protein